MRVPSAVLVELYRGGGTDATIDSVLARGFAQVETTGARTARVAGHLLAAAGAGSELAIVRLPSRQRSASVVAWSSHMIPAT